VLVVNPHSGGGKAKRAGLAGRARELGIEVVVLRPHEALEPLLEDAVARGADALGVAGGDGSLAAVAAAAVAHALPFVCVPAGTRNHFALDLGIDRRDPLGALDAFTHGSERRVDVGEVNGRLFLNNVSLGIYGDAVRQPGYREAKARTLLETAAQVLGPSAPADDLQLVDERGRVHRDPAVVLVSNNPYSLDRSHPRGTRPALDGGRLGILVLEKPRSRRSPARSGTASGLDVAGAEPVHAGIDGEPVVLDPPLRFALRPRALLVRVPQRRRHEPETATPAGRNRRASPSSGGTPSSRDVQLLLQLPDALLDRGVELRLALLAHGAPRGARGGGSSILGRLELVHHLAERAARDLAVGLLHLPVDDLDRRLVDARDHGGRPRRDRPAELRERLV